MTAKRTAQKQFTARLHGEKAASFLFIDFISCRSRCGLINLIKWKCVSSVTPVRCFLFGVKGQIIEGLACSVNSKNPLKQIFDL